MGFCSSRRVEQRVGLFGSNESVEPADSAALLQASKMSDRTGTGTSLWDSMKFLEVA
jgi:hypothetical protein